MQADTHANSRFFFPSRMGGSSSSSSPSSARLFKLGDKVSKALGSRIPFTIRGTILLFICIYLVAYLAWSKNDIVAAVVGLFILSIVIGSALLTLVAARNFESSLSGRLFADSIQGGASEDSLTSGQPVRFLIRLGAARVLPGFVLRLQIDWLDSGVSVTQHLLRGFTRKERVIFEDGSFPHRGRWIPQTVKFSYGDRLGLARLSWEVPSFFAESEFTVRPPRVIERALPLLSSSSRQGDELPAVNERQGDLYDLKSYHPSDGMRKILWKIYAKSGQLIARHPEKSMSPEGKTAMFILARKQDDDLCSRILSYLALLEELGISLSVGCQGMGKSTCALSSAAAEELLIESVWDSEILEEAKAREETSTFLASLREAPGGESLEKIVAPVADSYFERAETFRILVSSLQGLSDDSATPVILLEQESPLLQKTHSSNRMRQKMQGLLLLRSTPATAPNAQEEDKSSRFREEFLAICAKHNWEVLFI